MLTEAFFKKTISIKNLLKLEKNRSDSFSAAGQYFSVVFLPSNLTSHFAYQYSNKNEKQNPEVKYFFVNTPEVSYFFLSITGTYRRK